MARLPSFDSQIETAKADAQKVQELSSQLAASIAVLPDVVSETAFEAETAQLAELRSANTALEAELLTLIKGFAARTDAAYADFDRVDEVTRREKVTAFFTRRAAGSFKAVRLKKLAIAELLKVILLEAAAVHAVLHTRKDDAAPLVSTCEPKLEASMQARRKVVSSMDDARQRDKALAASLATLQRKITDASDESRLSQLKADEAEATTQRDAVLAERKKLGRQHDILDRQAILFGDLIDLLNDEISLHTLLLNALNIEAERCLQLYDAVFGSLEALLSEAEPRRAVAEGEETSLPLSAFRELLLLHTQGAVTMQDIEKRKKRVDEALLRRGERPAANGG